MLELSEAMNRSKEAVSNIPALYNENTSNRETVQDYYDTQFISKAELIAFLLETDPSALNEQSDHYHFYYDKDGSKQFLYGENGQRIKSVGSSGKLEELCRVNNIESIYVFDEEGRTIGTSTPNWFFTISNNKEDQSYEFRPLLDGRTDSYVQAIKTNDLGKTAQFVGVAFHYYTKEDKNGNLVYVSRYQANSSDVTSHRAMIQIELDAEESERLNQATDYAFLMPTFIENSFIKMYEAEGAHRCLYSPFLDQVGMTAENLSVPKKALNSNFYCRFEGMGSFEQIIFYQRSDDFFFETTMSHGDVFQRRTTTALTTAVIAFLLILILCATVTLTSKEEEELYADSYLIPDTFPWFAGSPEQKLSRMCRLVAAILLLSVLTALYLAERNFDDHSLLRFVIGGEWDKGVHLFAFSKAALVVLMIVFTVTLIRIPFKQLPSLFGARGETVGHLLMSLVEYTGALGAVFYTMHLFGVNSTQLIASAGLLTLIIGLGSQSLIKDIISGLFIVFEGEFQVGDIVTIHGHRGIVQDIGLRTTKILGIDGEKGNLKIVNNSEITEVLNMAYAPSEVTIRISIEYGQDLEYVEAVLRRDLPALAEEYSDILTGLRYNGVGLLAESGVELVILCNCDEIYWKRARNIMNRGVLEIFYRNGINVPFPNVTVSHLDTSGRKTMKDFTDTKSADREDSKR